MKNVTFTTRSTRRQAAIAAAIGGVAAIVPTATRQVDALPRAGVGGGNGIAGGGAMKLAAGVAHFSLFASRLESEEDADPQVFGDLEWVDPSWESKGVTLKSLVVTAYGQPSDEPASREIRGELSVDGEGRYPFVLRAIDAGAVGSGKDAIRLTVEAGPDFSYSAEGPITAGGVTLLRFDSSTASA